MQKLDEDGIFKMQKINYRPDEAITQLCACNNVLVLGQANSTILRIFLNQAEKRQSYEIPRSLGDRIEHVYLDPTGQHILISTKIGENFYVHEALQKPKPLPKLKGSVVTAVGWNHELSRPETTGFILLGTKKGVLIETEILQGGQMQYYKVVCNLGGDPDPQQNPQQVFQPITGIQLHRCSTPSGRWAVFVTTPGVLYPFAGVVSMNTSSSWVGTDVGVLQSLFRADQDSQLARVHSLETPQSFSTADGQLSSVPRPLLTDCLHMYPSIGGGSDAEVQWFCWLSASVGVKYGRLDTTQTDPYNMLQAPVRGAVGPRGLICHPDDKGRPDVPLSVALTEFHILLVYSNRFIAISVLNEHVAYEDDLGKKFGKLVGLSRDPISGMIWVFTDTSVLKYQPKEEGRYVWRIYLELGDYNSARKYAYGNAANVDMVLRKEAAKLLSDKKYVAAAEVFATSAAPFEDTALKFVQTPDRNGLKTYLEKKLDQLAPLEKTQQAMLVMWLLELNLAELNETKAGAAEHGDTATVSMDAYKHAKQQFRFFLSRPAVIECLKDHSEAAMQMMTSHGDVDTLLYFADLLRDYETVINLYVQQERYEEALNVLKKQRDSRLFYQFSANLIDHICSSLIETWRSQSNLNPKRLLPALFHCDRDTKMAMEAIGYLEHCVEKCGEKDSSIHNYLLSLYVKFEPKKLLNYLQTQGMDPTAVTYDSNYALRICSERGLNRACVHIYCTLGLFEDAVNLALKESVELAKQCIKTLQALEDSFSMHLFAERSENEELRKKLWLKIACHVVQKDKDIKKCMELLQESEGLIKIQDLLPFFPENEFATIEHFKDALCACLKEHSGRIQQLQREMKEATDVASDIRKDMIKEKATYTVVKVQDRCGSCEEPVMTRPFYAFPCRHFFHTGVCIERESAAVITQANKKQLQELQRRLSTPFARDRSEGDDVAKWKEELDSLLAEQCPWCGDAIIDTIDRPFFSTPSDYVRELKSWDVV